jgi:hypothetical protein
MWRLALADKHVGRLQLFLLQLLQYAKFRAAQGMYRCNAVLKYFNVVYSLLEIKEHTLFSLLKPRLSDRSSASNDESHFL